MTWRAVRLPLGLPPPEGPGFLSVERLVCRDCGHDKLPAFSREGRGFCPSCGPWRMAQTAGASAGPRDSARDSAAVGAAFTV